MKMTSTQIEQTLHQLDAEAIPPNIRLGVVVNLARWTDANKSDLQPHEPEPTEVVVELEADRLH